MKVPNGQTLRYTTEAVDIAIENNDNNFTIYDLKDNLVSKTLTRTETNKALRTINEGLNAHESENITATALSDNVSDIGNNARTVSDNGNTVSGNATAVQDGERFAIDNDLLAFIDSIDSMQNPNAFSKRKHTLGAVSEKHKSLIKNILSAELGIDMSLEGYSVNIDGSAIKHIEEKHGANGTSDHSMQNKEDVARLGWAINNADTGYIARTQNGQIDYSTHYKNRDGSRSPKIILEKATGDGKFIVIECVPDSQAKQIHIISARKINSDNGQVLNVESNNSPQPTSKTPLDDNVAINSIPQTTEKSNSFSEKTSENSSDNTKKTKYQLEAEEFDRLANKEVEEYKKLSEPNRAMIRKILRQAKARGMSEADALSLARVSARSGVDIVIGKEYCKRTGLDENGKTVTWYADGFYSERTGKIYVNPESTRNYASLLVHEFLHASKSMTGALKSTKKVYTRLLELAKSSMSDADIKAIEERYSSAYGNKQQLIDEEIIAEYGETFAGEQFISSLLSDEPTLFEKLLAHFRGAS
ncbi:MAG: hypothetical protein IJW48_04790, partial [Clostridia bacterium]|nr:hypothetical protein [Clostridia bacterium]